VIAASTFSGFGGTCRGMGEAGFRVAYACELDPYAADTYELNGGCKVDRRPIEKVKGEEVIEACGRVPDLFEGSPPCQDFSTMGNRNLEGQRAALFAEWVRLAGEVGAPAICAENVTGLVKGEALRAHFLPIVAALEGLGYRVAAQRLDCSWLGVPQVRERVLIVGLKKELGVDPAEGFPRRGDRRATLEQALPGLAAWERRGAPAGTEKQAKYRRPKRYEAHLPLPTVCASGIDANKPQYMVAVPKEGEPRPITVEELAVVSGFPASFEVPPSPMGKEQARVERAWKGFGNCWPPPAAEAVARGIAACLEGAREPA
jgi:DNA (cytosine-5)-methyltransferase 1